MKNLLPLIGAYMLITACNNQSGTDVSNVSVDLRVERFEKAFFAIDSNHIKEGLKQVKQQFPVFADEFTVNILGAGPIVDSNHTVTEATGHFLSSYRQVYAMLEKKYNNITSLEKELRTAFQHVRYYFPQYKVPQVVTYVGPFDAPGVAITPTALAIGLQLYAGKDFSFYNSDVGMEMFPPYISRRFEKEYITVNCMKAVSEDLFPDNSASLPLVEQMIEKGKYWYLLHSLLPATADSIITGYTQQQLNWCKNNEGVIWNIFLQNNELLYSTDPGIVQLYIGEGPYTQGLPEASPGNVGQWIGWRIVQVYMQKNKDVQLLQLMKTPAKTILQEAKYKPK